MLRHLAKESRRLAVLLVVATSGLVVSPALPFQSVSIALADDDDDDGGGGGSSGRGDRGSGDYHSGRKPLRDLRTLFRWPSREVRRTPARRVVALPNRAQNEIVAIGLDAASLAGLTQDGFVIAQRTQVALTGGEMVRLRAPQGMTIDAARTAVATRNAAATVDFNHFYQPQAKDEAACAGTSCALVRYMVGWPAETGSDGPRCLKPQRIGLIDTAINADHSSLAEARLEILRLDEMSGTPSGAQHGTAVAALLVGAPGSRVPGLLPASELVAVDAFQRLRKSSDVANVYDLVRALDLLMQRDIRVINLSLTGPSNLLLERAVKAAIEKGTILVAAAGNDGPNAKPVYPAAYEDVIAVTAVDAARKPYRRAVRGGHIDIAAPGVNVWTAASVSGARQKSGTSFAAPFVTAAVSVLVATRPDLSPSEIEAELMKSTEDIGQPGKDPVYGWGLLNAKALCQG
ncbi:S8 family serine peptidase [Shinella kummerowiae]|uniref:S8 family serine peptidase n=1 Tax=Shinella kummerowiae TaxID=417745 RepID=A0A6N8SD29_9HYPH|nr:S8 family serine peptidase [Shinella kummerowiae]MXN45468.1 S8 family serine peptidase [Shinella kummerowiae]